MPAGARARSPRTAPQLRASPAAPPAAATSRLSPSTCQASRERGGAQRQPHRQFTLAADGARQEQGRHVGAGDEQQQQHGGHQADHARGGSRRRTPRASAPGEAPALVLRVGPLELPREHRGLRLGASRLTPAAGARRGRSCCSRALRSSARPCASASRGRLPKGRSMPAGITPITSQLAPSSVSVWPIASGTAPKPALPEAVAQDDHVGRGGSSSAAANCARGPAGRQGW